MGEVVLTVVIAEQVLPVFLLYFSFSFLRWILSSFTSSFF